MRVGSIDIGSNTIVAVVAERERGTWTPVMRDLRITRISENLDATDTLADGPVERTRAALKEVVETIKNLGATKVLATGTAPFRRADNGASVAGYLSNESGVSIDVIDGEREARLSLLATTASFPDLGDLLVVDIGGASTELIAVDNHTLAQIVSLDVGSVRLTERCLHGNPPSSEERRAFEALLEEILAEERVSLVLGGGSRILIGVAGTVTTLAANALQLEEYDPKAVHGFRLSLATLSEQYEQLMGMSASERAGQPGIAAGRADVIAAGAGLLLALARHAGMDEVLVSDRGTAWGRLYDEFGV